MTARRIAELAAPTPPLFRGPDELVTLSKSDLFAYFEDHANFVADTPNPRFRYQIKFGSRTLRDADTYDLRKKFEATVKAHATHIKRKGFMLVAAFLFVALNARTQEFRIADQIYLPSAIHIGQWTTDATITNETDDPVSVSVQFVQANSSPVPLEKRGAFRLAPHATSRSEDTDDIIGKLGWSGMGQLLFKGCLEGADCTPDPATGLNPNYRNISVESITCSKLASGGRLCQGMPGLAWWDYGDRNYPLKVVGIRVGPQYHTNFGIVNTSQYAGVWLWAALYDGPSHAVRDRTHVHLVPMEPYHHPITDLFPLLGEWSRLNRTRTTNSAYVTIELDSVEPVASGVPADCYDSCAAFLAYGSLIDNVSGAATTLEATFGGEGGALNAAQVYGMFSKSSEVAAARMDVHQVQHLHQTASTAGVVESDTLRGRPRDAVNIGAGTQARPATSEVVPLCWIVPLGPYEYQVKKYDAAGQVVTWMHLGPPRPATDPLGEMTMGRIAREAERARALCGVTKGDK